jgi:ATP-dependent Clp protease ATP-binding subunit ClpX
VVKCSFCGKSERFGVRLVRGPGVAICEECVKLAAEVIEGMPEAERPAATVRLEVFGESRASGVGPFDANG